MFTQIRQSLLGLKQPVDPLWSLATVSIFLATVANVPLWFTLWRLPDVAGARGVLLAIALWLAIAAVLFALQSVLAGRYTSKVIAMLMMACAAPAVYFMMSYGIVIDASMIKNTLQTDVKESRELMNAGLVATVLCIGFLPCAWLALRRHRSLGFRSRLIKNTVAAFLACVLAFVSVYAVKGDLATLMRNHTKLRYLITPLNIFYGLGRVAIGEAKPLPFQSLGAATASNPSATIPVLVLVVGETARADHFSLNGYARNTNPLLAQQAVISFNNVSSCGTNTADSVPCMFSHLGREAFFSRTAKHENALDLLKKAGYSVVWLDNNSGCKGVCERIPTEDLSKATHPTHCANGECFDEVLTADLAKRAQSMREQQPQSKGVVIVLHQLGSHGPAYYKRSPQSGKQFQPECTTNVLQSCDAASIVNAYDNSIAYTDKVLSQVITQLKTLPPQYAPAMVYMSDHGESLGEGGTYLHGLPYAIAPKAQKHVPLIVWLSPAMQQHRGIQEQCLRKQTSTALSHDYLFHSVLSLLSVNTSSLNPSLDWFKPCL